MRNPEIDKRTPRASVDLRWDVQQCDEADFSQQILRFLPKLTAYAKRLARMSVTADDLVQETVLRALIHADQFMPGTNLDAWLIVILRNCYLNQRRNAWRIEYFDPAVDEGPATNPAQEWQVLHAEVQRHVTSLPAERKAALDLVVVEGKSYEQAAVLAQCAVGTIKSRVARARSELLEKIHATADKPRAHRALATDPARSNRSGRGERRFIRASSS